MWSGNQPATLTFTQPGTGAPAIVWTVDEAYEAWAELGVALGELPRQPVDPDQAMEWLADFITMTPTRSREARR